MENVGLFSGRAVGNRSRLRMPLQLSSSSAKVESILFLPARRYDCDGRISNMKNGTLFCRYGVRAVERMMEVQGKAQSMDQNVSPYFPYYYEQ